MNKLFPIVLVLLFIFSGCAVNKTLKNDEDKVCLVLSIGAEKGLAQLGGIEALRDLGYSFDCIYGNSAGSIVGAIYSNKPNANLRKEAWELGQIYLKKTKQEAEGSAVLGFFASLLFGFNPILGGFIGSSSIEIADIDRFSKSADIYFKSKKIQNLKISYATSYYDTRKGLVTINKGSIAKAIKNSCNTPLIFGFDENDRKFDAGMDRMSANPIQDAYDLFDPDKIILLNVSNNKAVYNKKIQVDEIIINAKKHSKDCIDSKNKVDFKNCINNMYDEGYNTVMEYYNSE